MGFLFSSGGVWGLVSPGGREWEKKERTMYFCRLVVVYVMFVFFFFFKRNSGSDAPEETVNGRKRKTSPCKLVGIGNFGWKPHLRRWEFHFEGAPFWGVVVLCNSFLLLFFIGLRHFMSQRGIPHCMEEAVIAMGDC